MATMIILCLSDHSPPLAKKLCDNFYIPARQMRKLNIFTCIQVALRDHMDSWQANHYEIQSENRKWIIQHNLKEFVFEGWHSFLVHYTKNLAWGAKTLKRFFWCFFSVYFWVLVCSNFLFSCQTNYTDNKAIWVFLFLAVNMKNL